MKNLFILRQLVIFSLNRKRGFARPGVKFGAAIILALVVVGGTPHLVSQAQEGRAPHPGFWGLAQSGGAGKKGSLCPDKPFILEAKMLDREWLFFVLAY